MPKTGNNQEAEQQNKKKTDEEILKQTYENATMEEKDVLTSFMTTSSFKTKMEKRPLNKAIRSFRKINDKIIKRIKNLREEISKPAKEGEPKAVISNYLLVKPAAQTSKTMGTIKRRSSIVKKMEEAFLANSAHIVDYNKASVYANQMRLYDKIFQKYAAYAKAHGNMEKAALRRGLVRDVNTALKIANTMASNEQGKEYVHEEIKDRDEILFSDDLKLRLANIKIEAENYIAMTESKSGVYQKKSLEFADEAKKVPKFDEKTGQPITTSAPEALKQSLITSGSYEYKILVESQKAIRVSRAIKDKVVTGKGWALWGHIWRWGKAAKALKEHNTVKDRAKQVLGQYQAYSLEPYNELHKELSEKALNKEGYTYEDAISKFSEILKEPSDAEKKRIKGLSKKMKEQEAGKSAREKVKSSKYYIDTNKMHSAIAGKPNQVAINGEVFRINNNRVNDNRSTLFPFENAAAVYDKLLELSYQDPSSAGYKKNLQDLLDRYANAMDYVGPHPVAYEYIQTATKRRALMRDPQMCYMILMQCAAQTMFDSVNEYGHGLISIEEFGKVAAVNNVTKLAAQTMLDSDSFKKKYNDFLEDERKENEIRAGIMKDLLIEKFKKDNTLSDEMDKEIVQKILAEVNSEGFKEGYVPLVDGEDGKNVYGRQKNTRSHEVYDQLITTAAGIGLGSKKGVENVETFSHDDFTTYYDQYWKPVLTNLGDRKAIINDYIDECLKENTKEIPYVKGAAMKNLIDKMQSSILFGDMWDELKELQSKARDAVKDDTAKVIYMNRCREIFDVFVGDDGLNEIAKNVKAIEDRANDYADTFNKTLKDLSIEGMQIKAEDIYKNSELVKKMMEISSQDFEKLKNDKAKSIGDNFAAIKKVTEGSFMGAIYRDTIVENLKQSIIRRNDPNALERMARVQLLNCINNSDETLTKLQENVNEALVAVPSKWHTTIIKSLGKEFNKDKDAITKALSGSDSIRSYVDGILANIKRNEEDYMATFKGIYMSEAQLNNEVSFLEENLANVSQTDFRKILQERKEAGVKNGLYISQPTAGFVKVDGVSEKLQEVAESKKNETPNYADLLKKDVLNSPQIQAAFGKDVAVDRLIKVARESRDPELAFLKREEFKEGKISGLSEDEYDILRTKLTSRLTALADAFRYVGDSHNQEAIRMLCFNKAFYPVNGETIDRDEDMAKLVENVRNGQELRDEIAALRSFVLMGQSDVDNKEKNNEDFLVNKNLHVVYSKADFKEKPEEAKKRYESIQSADYIWNRIIRRDFSNPDPKNPSYKRSRELMASICKFNTEFNRRHKPTDKDYQKLHKEQLTEFILRIFDPIGKYKDDNAKIDKVDESYDNRKKALKEKYNDILYKTFVDTIVEEQRKATERALAIAGVADMKAQIEKTIDDTRQAYETKEARDNWLKNYAVSEDALQKLKTEANIEPEKYINIWREYRKEIRNVDTEYVDNRGDERLKALKYEYADCLPTVAERKLAQECGLKAAYMEDGLGEIHDGVTQYKYKQVEYKDAKTLQNIATEMQYFGGACDIMTLGSSGDYIFNQVEGEYVMTAQRQAENIYNKVRFWSKRPGSGDFELAVVMPLLMRSGFLQESYMVEATIDGLRNTLNELDELVNPEKKTKKPEELVLINDINNAMKEIASSRTKITNCCTSLAQDEKLDTDDLYRQIDGVWKNAEVVMNKLKALYPEDKKGKLQFDKNKDAKNSSFNKLQEYFTKKVGTGSDAQYIHCEEIKDSIKDAFYLAETSNQESKDKYGIYNFEELMNAQSKVFASGEEGYKNGAYGDYLGKGDVYRKQVAEFLKEDAKLPEASQLSRFLPILSQDDGFIMTMTQDRKLKENEEGYKEYFRELRERLAPFMEAYTEKHTPSLNEKNPPERDLITDAYVIDRFILMHGKEILQGTSNQKTVEMWKKQILGFETASLNVKTNGKNYLDVLNENSRKMPAKDRLNLLAELIQLGVVSPDIKYESPEVISKTLEFYWTRKNNNIKALTSTPEYNALEEIKVDRLAVNDEKLAKSVINGKDIYAELHAVDYFLHSEKDFKGKMLGFIKEAEEHARNYSIGENRTAVIRDDETYRKYKTQVNKKILSGKKVYAIDHKIMDESNRMYYNGVSPIIASYSGDQAAVLSQDQLEKYKSIVDKTVRDANKELTDMHIADEDKTILAELFAADAIKKKTFLMHDENISAAYDAIQEFKANTDDYLMERSKLEGDKALKNDAVREREINRFVTYLASQGRLQFEPAEDGFFLRAVEFAGKHFNSLFKKIETLEEAPVSKKERKNDVGALWADYRSKQQVLDNYYNDIYEGKLAYPIDAFPANENHDFEKSVVNDIISECIADGESLKMAMFTVKDEKVFKDLIESRMYYYRNACDFAKMLAPEIETAVEEYYEEESTESKLLRKKAVFNSMLDYFQADIKELQELDDEQKNRKMEAMMDRAGKYLNPEDEIGQLDKKKASLYMDVFNPMGSAYASIDTRGYEDAKRVRGKANYKDYESAINKVNSSVSKKFDSLSETERTALAIALALPINLTSVKRYGSIDVIGNHVRQYEAYHQYEKDDTKELINKRIQDLVGILNGDKKPEEIDYEGAIARLQKVKGTSRNTDFNAAFELVKAVEREISEAKKDWNVASDVEENLSTAMRNGKSFNEMPNKLKDAEEFMGWLKKQVGDKVDIKGVDANLVITLLQNRTMLDESSDKKNDGASVNKVMREKFIKQWVADPEKKEEYMRKAQDPYFITKAMKMGYSYQLKDDVAKNPRALTNTDYAPGALDRETQADVKLLVSAVKLAKEIQANEKRLVNKKGFDEKVYNSLYELNGHKTFANVGKAANDVLEQIHTSINGKYPGKADDFDVYKADPYKEKSQAQLKSIVNDLKEKEISQLKVGLSKKEIEAAEKEMNEDILAAKGEKLAKEEKEKNRSSKAKENSNVKDNQNDKHGVMGK